MKKIAESRRRKSPALPLEGKGKAPPLIPLTHHFLTVDSGVWEEIKDGGINNCRLSRSERRQCGSYCSPDPKVPVSW